MRTVWQEIGVRSKADRLIGIVCAMALGGFLLFGAAFAPIEALHNAAHDARHSFAFPCH
ncbi:MAG: CbtB-domain containing protein [Geminicoccaceae bacterium]|nr:CbtB-domain containing protein [Geminicoccaceae bacterium]